MKKLKEQLRPLSMKEKIEYLIEYYSFHVIGVIVVLCFLAMGFNTFANQQKELLSIHIVKDNIIDDQAKELRNELEKGLLDHNKKKLSVQAINTSDIPNNSEAVLKLQKLAAEIAAKEVDVLLVDKEVFQQFNEDGNLYDLSNFHVFDDWKVRKYPSVKDPETITGIDVSKVPYLSSIVTKGEPLLLVVMANTERLDGVKEFGDLLDD
ncbi:hypothetical protein ACIQZI_16715 [Peribacillus sp. NPDC096379]|uniref:hypothetical protein n=1 Tax=Peribacillus sp. NPDC096379 TaxID=3364393 RepID=UPI0037F333E7